MPSEGLTQRPQVTGAEHTSLFRDLDLGQAATPQGPITPETEDLEASSSGEWVSPVMSLVDRILIESLTSGASDIHVEPQEDGLLVRFR